MVEPAQVADWDAEVERLLVEARSRAQRRHRRCRCPAACRRPRLMRLREDADAFARELARPMPRPPSRAARFGTLFHAWVEGRFEQQPLLDPDDLPGRADLDIADEADLDDRHRGVRAGPVRRPRAARRRGVVRARPRRPGGARPDRRGLPGGRRLVPRRRLEDQPGRRPPTRSSSRSTGSPGPSSSACRSSRSARRSTTCGPARPCSPTTCRTGPSWRACSRSADAGAPARSRPCRRTSARAPATSSPRR